MGCGCNNNFSGQKKQCSCGRNAGGNCQCNQRKLNTSGRNSIMPTGGITPARQTAGDCEMPPKCIGIPSMRCIDCDPPSTGKQDIYIPDNSPRARRAKAKQGRKPQQNLQQRLKSNKTKFSSFMGTSQNYPQVDTKKYGISDEHYYEFNSPSNVRTGINYNDIDVSF